MAIHRVSVPKVALLSVYDKAGLASFTKSLLELGCETILASSGTAKYLNDKGIKARDVAEIVGPPILGHRVVTLSREIHAALLSTKSREDKAELKRLGIPRIDLVYVNFYPLREEINRKGRTLKSVIEKTDIGGPTLLRSAAKGRRLVITRPEDLDMVLAFLNGSFGMGQINKFISHLVARAEWDVADYCKASYHFHDEWSANQ